MDIQASIDRILAAEDRFGYLFYDHYLRRYPEVRRYFEDVDLRRQGVLLMMALRLIVEYELKRYRSTEAFLHYLGTKHHNMQVPKELYADWCRAMLETLEQFHGEDWNSVLAEHWKDALDRSVEAMHRGYDEHFTV